MGNPHRQERRQEAAFTLGEATGFAEAAQPLNGDEQFSTNVVETGVGDVQLALQTVLANGAFKGLRASDVDVEFAAHLGVQLRKDSWGNELALQSTDITRGTSRSLEVTVAEKDGEPVLRSLGGTLAYNKALGLAVFAGRILTAARMGDIKDPKSLRSQVKLLHGELTARRVTPAERKAVVAAFLAPHKVRVDLKVAREFLRGLEGKPQRHSAYSALPDEVRKAMDEAFAVIGKK